MHTASLATKSTHTILSKVIKFIPFPSLSLSLSSFLLPLPLSNYNPNYKEIIHINFRSCIHGSATSVHGVCVHPSSRGGGVQGIGQTRYVCKTHSVSSTEVLNKL